MSAVDVSHRRTFFVASAACWDYDGHDRHDSQMVANDQVGFLCFANCHLAQGAEVRRASICNVQLQPRTVHQDRSVRARLERYSGLSDELVQLDQFEYVLQVKF